MGSLRDIRKRIKSVNSTQKITKAMKMVAAARLRRAQARVQDGRPYAEKINELLQKLAASAPEGVHPLLGGRETKKRVLIILSSDRGLCGAFNAGLFRQIEIELKKETLETNLVLIGRKAIEYFGKRNYSVHKVLRGFWDDFDFEKASDLIEELCEEYLEEKVDRVDVYFNEFRSVISQKPTCMTIAPMTKPEKTEAENQEEEIQDYLYEPDRTSLVQTLIPRAIQVRFYQSCANSLASEYGARMTAMDSATRNAGEMIDKLTLDMNRARQAAITTELMEIISGAEALK